MSKNLVWIDLETTGLKPKHHGIIEIAILFEKEGEIVEEWVSKVNCGEYDRDVAVDPEALRINGNKLEDIATFPLPIAVHNEIRAKLAKHYGSEKVSIAGYNVSVFDKPMLEDFYASNNEEYWYYFNHKPIDIFEMVKGLQYMGIMEHTWNQKLITIVEEFGFATKDEIEEKAHNALWDIQMTRKIYLMIKEAMDDAFGDTRITR